MKARDIVNQLLEATASSGKWLPVYHGEKKRIDQKTVNGVPVQRLQFLGTHTRSMSGRGILGNYARERWATLRFTSLGETFTSWNDFLSFVNDPDAVAAAKKKVGLL